MASLRKCVAFLTALGVAFVLCAQPSALAITYPETREYQLGDVDGFSYEGVGSEDDVYLSPGMQAWLAIPRVPRTSDFDELHANQLVPFTLEFPLATGEQVTAATLTFALRATDGLVTTDWAVFHKDNPIEDYPYYTFSDLGWLPVPQSGTSMRTLDLASVLGDDRLPLLQDGVLDMRLTDDVGIDYATLRIEVDLEPDYVIPEPVTLASGLIGFGLVGSYIRKRLKPRLSWGRKGEPQS